MTTKRELDLDVNGQVLSIRRADGREILSIIAQDVDGTSF